MQWLPPAAAVRERYGLGNSRDRSLTRPPGPTARLVQSIPKELSLVRRESGSGLACRDQRPLHEIQALMHCRQLSPEFLVECGVRFGRLHMLATQPIANRAGDGSIEDADEDIADNGGATESDD